MKLTPEQEREADAMYSGMCGEILPDVFREIVWLRERVSFVSDMLDDYDIVCDQCKYATALKFRDRARVIMKEKEVEAVGKKK